MTSDRLYPARPFLAASVAVFRDGRVLIAARARPPMNACTACPAVSSSLARRLAEAALRELHEEVGVEADLLGFVDHVEAMSGTEGRVSHHFVICAHAARWRAGEPRIGAEASDVRWVREDEIAGLETTPGLAGVLRKAFALAEASPHEAFPALAAALPLAAPAGGAAGRGSSSAPRRRPRHRPAPAARRAAASPLREGPAAARRGDGLARLPARALQAPDAAEWPNRMQALIDTEGTTPGRRERLAGAYNRGYRGFAITYRICTPSAPEATGRYLKEGETLSRESAGRFGG